MEALVELLIRDSQSQHRSKNPRQLFFREFDQLLKMASRTTTQANIEAELDQLEAFGRAAGISETELTSRKNTVLWTISQAA